MCPQSNDQPFWPMKLVLRGCFLYFCERTFIRMKDKTSLGSVDRQLQSGICTITFSHPAHNSLPGQLLATLEATIEAAGADKAIRVIILRSGGERTFCAGASFDELVAIRDEAQGKAFFSGFAGVINAIRKCPKFILGRVQGKAIGGGVGLGLRDRLLRRYPSTPAVKLSELAIGIGPIRGGPSRSPQGGHGRLSSSWR
jgi:methylglutaconyl-CoA hydratase